MKIRVPKAVLGALLSVVVLAVLAAGGGLAYTYFLGPSSTGAPAVPATPPPPAETAARPAKPAANAKEGVSVASLTSPAAPGSNAAISVQTNAGSKCSISVVYGSEASTDSGLAPKTADEYGTVSWTWTVSASAPLGTWPVKVTCVYNGRSAVVQGDLVVAKATDQAAGPTAP